MPLFNPKTDTFDEFDPKTRELLAATVEFFETKGKEKLVADGYSDRWYDDWMQFLADSRVLAYLATPTAHADGDPDKRWDTARIAKFNEITGFYGSAYWYAWGVSTLGLVIIYSSENALAHKRAAAELDRGGIIGFGLSERDHGADIYATDMLLTPDGNGGFTATGGKYYIGNGNVSRIIPTLARRTDLDGPDAYVWFIVDSQHPNYRLRKNIIHGQNFVSAFDLEDYPVAAEDVLHTGPRCFDVALAAVNCGKFNIGMVAAGIAQHCFYETINQASSKILFGHPVTEFGQVRRILTDSYLRLTAGRLYHHRAIDYMRSGTPEDRRFVMFNSIAKMKVSREAERVVTELLDVISARGFERDSYFDGARSIIASMPRLEGTAHVNMALTLKFMPSYLLNPGQLPPVPVRRDTASDDALFNQPAAQGLSKVRFADWRPAYQPFAQLPNVAAFVEQAEALGRLATQAPPTQQQLTDLDYLLAVGDLFTLIPYGQLIVEQAKIEGTSSDIVDSIFEVLVRDFSAFALDLHSKASSTQAQQDWALSVIRKPVIDAERSTRVYGEVCSHAGEYQMNP
ncbi:acyl-CoA dehydrogenase family protein [Mycobacterium talmoniae]|uniref:Acyl-CoA dehydrogenase n=1 Tax=Mycobacterium talmoniae TaxID=1858794 RepID=A0A1S1NI91_9MYCO|nr:acyl-CoA dehydrogenase family protein [Mycobacterium talmoniae]OHV03673.1 acyl-CoA dehydrogenase [Mycobacterium talmoniae]